MTFREQHTFSKVIVSPSFIFATSEQAGSEGLQLALDPIHAAILY
jgi:hypothetical protein